MKDKQELIRQIRDFEKTSVESTILQYEIRGIRYVPEDPWNPVRNHIDMIRNIANKQVGDLFK